MRFFRHILNEFLGIFGYQAIANRELRRLTDLAAFSKSETSLSHQLREVISAHNIDCVFDVGANEGQFASFLREEVKYKGWILSFEPLPDLAALLENRARNDDCWKVIPLALSSRSEEAVFRRTAETVFSSFHPSSSKQPEKYFEASQTVEEIPVVTSRVDAVWQEQKDLIAASRLLLKMDTQGHDLEVFAGASESLPDIPVLLSELSFARIYDDSSTFQNSLATFEAAGYSPSAFFPVSFGDGHAAIEMDGLFVRTNQ